MRQYGSLIGSFFASAALALAACGGQPELASGELYGESDLAESASEREHKSAPAGCISGTILASRDRTAHEHEYGFFYLSSDDRGDDFGAELIPRRPGGAPNVGARMTLMADGAPVAAEDWCYDPGDPREPFDRKVRLLAAPLSTADGCVAKRTMLQLFYQLDSGL